MRTIVALFFLLLTNTCFAQWDYVEYSEQDQAIVSIGVPVPGGIYSGTGVLVARNQTTYTILTCYHLQKGDAKIFVKLYDGSVYDATIVKGDPFQDLMWLAITVHKDLVMAKLGILPRDKEEVTVCGLGGRMFVTPDRFNLRKFKTSVFPLKSNWIYLEAPIIQGDSGGAVFNKEGYLIGIISGGPICFENKYIWPGTASSIQSIKEFFERK